MIVKMIYADSMKEIDFDALGPGSYEIILPGICIPITISERIKK
jgi:hypothetical protein